MYISYFLIHLKGIVHCVEKKKNLKKRKKSPRHGYCETVLCHFVMCPFVYDPCKRVSGEGAGVGRQGCGGRGGEWAGPSTQTGSGSSPIPPQRCHLPHLPALICALPPRRVTSTASAEPTPSPNLPTLHPSIRRILWEVLGVGR